MKPGELQRNISVMVFASSRDIDGAQTKFQDGVPSEFYSKRG